MEHPLRQFRVRNRISLDALADEARCAKASLSRIERGKQQPSLDLIRKLIEISSQREQRPLTADDFINFPPAQTVAA